MTCGAVQYNSYTTHYKEAECLRMMVEPFLYNFGVDIVFHGAPQQSSTSLPCINHPGQSCPQDCA